MKILFFDLERGSQTLGGQAHIQKLFGLPMLAPATWDAFNDILKQIYSIKKTIVEQKVSGITVKEEQRASVLNEGVDLQAVVIDTFSELSKKKQRELVAKRQGRQMQIPDWGVLRNSLDEMLVKVTSLPGIVIANCHSKISSLDDGTTKINPYIDGSTKEDIAKWFDFVFYTHTTVDKMSGKRDYHWITARSEKYDNAKDRTSTLDNMIPQDYQIPIEAAKKAGFKNVRILIIGAPGSGKTYSLQTLVKPVVTTTVNSNQERKLEGATA